MVATPAHACSLDRCYGNKPPFAHHTSLGWALVGESCAVNDVNKDVCDVCEDKLKECIQVMSKYISLGHVEMIPSEEQKPIRPNHAWWIPVFPVTHPKKNKVRIVFDSSAKYHGTSLNEKLLPGPDVMNILNDVLLGFRNGSIGFSADIEAMFHNFYLKDDERNYIRFFWFADNDPAQSVCQFCARVHIFGNCSSPAIAAHGYAAMMSDKKHVQQFTRRGLLATINSIFDPIGISAPILLAGKIL